MQFILWIESPVGCASTWLCFILLDLTLTKSVVFPFHPQAENKHHKHTLKQNTKEGISGFSQDLNSYYSFLEKKKEFRKSVIY